MVCSDRTSPARAIPWAAVTHVSVSFQAQAWAWFLAEWVAPCEDVSAERAASQVTSPTCHLSVHLTDVASFVCVTSSLQTKWTCRWCGRAYRSAAVGLLGQGPRVLGTGWEGAFPEASGFQRESYKDGVKV